jgi:NAD(P)-dependent dehydrogenase (short-subunit alcohol dehydrogenase family)
LRFHIVIVTDKVVVVTDVNGDAARQVAAEVGGAPIVADVSREATVTCCRPCRRRVCSHTPQSATYAVTKHASLAFAEWPSIAYGDRGIKVSALCPQGVRTDMLRRAASGGRTFLVDGALEPEQVADEAVKGLEAERFLILPHPEVAEYVRPKANDHERWLRGMRRLRAYLKV